MEVNGGLIVGLRKKLLQEDLWKISKLESLSKNSP